MKKPKDTNEYISAFPKEVQKQLKQLRTVIKKAAPRSEEVISYGMPAFKLNGMLVWFAGYKNHIGFYPKASPIQIFKKELAGYKTSKGAIQFPLAKPLPVALITKIVKYRLKENLTIEKPKPKTGSKNYIHYHNDGSIWAKGKMADGKMDGYWEWFRKDGVIMRSGYFNKNKQVGEWTTYDKKGKVYKITEMKK